MHENNQINNQPSQQFQQEEFEPLFDRQRSIDGGDCNNQDVGMNMGMRFNIEDNDEV